MKALSIQQPWAWAILLAGKPVENRRWPTKVRGRIVIHAGKKIDKDGVEWLRIRGYDVPINLPTGGFVGEVNIDDCIDLDHIRNGPRPFTVTDAQLRAISSGWAFGPYCFALSNPQAYDELIPARGMPGFFEVDI